MIELLHIVATVIILTKFGVIVLKSIDLENSNRLSIGYGRLRTGVYDTDEYITTVDEAYIYFDEVFGRNKFLPIDKRTIEKTLIERGFTPMSKQEFIEKSKLKPIKEYAKYRETGLYNFDTKEIVLDSNGERFTFKSAPEMRRFISTQGELSRMGNKNNGLHRLGLSHEVKLGVVLLYDIVEEGKHDTILEGVETYYGDKYYS